MSELLQEFVDSGSARLRVDRGAGVIRGVKLLGLQSRNHRRYREDALAAAVGLYEGAKVNINHPKGHPLSPRDYQDRLGVIRGVEFRAGEGLFGDLHFNPKHSLSEQLVWDAENASKNVGLSHNVLARVTRTGDDAVVDAITKVQSIDLVADPATTSGLFEQADGRATGGSNSSAATAWDALTLEQLELNRPDLVAELRRVQESELAQLRTQFDELAAREAAAERRRRITELLAEHGLSLPKNGTAARQVLLSEQFIEALMAAADDKALEQLVQERAELIRAARDLADYGAGNVRRPRSRDQLLPANGTARGGRSAAEFAAAVRGR